MPHRILSSVKDIGIASAGIVAIKLPDWFYLMNEALASADGFYKFGIFAATVLGIWYHHVRKQKK